MKTNTKKISSLFAVVAALAMGFATLAPQSAFAESGGGAGTLTAQGKGLAWFSGSGTATPPRQADSWAQRPTHVQLAARTASGQNGSLTTLVDGGRVSTASRGKAA